MGIRDGTDEARKVRTKAFWGSGIEGATRKVILKARVGRLPTYQNLFRWKYEKSPNCPLCPGVKEEESETHMFLRCMHPVMKAIYISRHNWVVHAIVKVIKRGSKGGCEIRWDGGTAGRVTIDESMLFGGFPPSVDEEGNICTPKTPDIVMIEKKRNRGNLGGILRIIEVTYGWDPSWEKKVELKVRKYGPLVEALREAGWVVHFYVVVVGVTGMSRRVFGEEDRKGLGISVKHCRTLEGRIARQTWLSARGTWKTRCVEVAEVRRSSGIDGVVIDAPT